MNHNDQGVTGSGPRTTAQETAFTLIEVLIVIGIVAIFMLVIVDLFIKNDSLMQSQMATVDVLGGARAILHDIHPMTLQTIRVMGSHTFSGTTINTSTSALVLELPSITAAGAIIAGQYDYVAYHASGTTAYRTIDGGSGSIRTSGQKRLTDTLNFITFTLDNANPFLATNVEVDVQTQKTVKNIDAETHVRQIFYLRNKSI
jgi:prepilin-type N-terminal cleavage/methylation domain-containing protein